MDALMSVAVGCPDEAQLSQFVTRVLVATAAASVEQHLADCDACRNLVFALATANEETGDEAPSTATKIGRFEVLDVVGRGAMGAVYRARDPELERIVALKVHHRRSRLDIEQEDRLRREAQALARLADPNVIAVFETGVHDDKPFVVMEYVAGETLQSWMSARRPVQAVVAVLARAGRGLAAAHASGLVHRDFKPSNVLVSRTGSVKVGDFGLVRLAGAPAEPAPDGPTEDMTLTLTGALLGTPAYMAPEQLDGGVATAASDQFSFCVVLYEALFGQRPFRGATLAELRAAMTTAVTFPASAVPARLRAVLARGLAAEPANRFASMRELCDALEHAPRRAWPYVAGVLAIAAVATIAWIATRPADDPCGGGDRELAGAWDRPIKEQVRTKLLAATLPYARDAWLGVERTLDAYAAAWMQARRAACEASRVHREQTAPVLALRMRCLDERLRELRTLTTTLANADDEMVSRSVHAAARLSAIEPCADVRTLMEQTAATQAVAAPRAEQLRDEIARGTALANLGKLNDGVGILDGVVAAAKREQLVAVEAHGLLELGRLQFLADGNAARAEQTVTAALLAADRSRDDYLRLRAYTVLSFLVGTVQTRFEEGDRLYEHGRAVLQRLVGAERYEAQLLGNRGHMLALQGKLPEAERTVRASLEVMERAYGRDHPEVAIAYATLSGIELALGDHVEALALAERAYEIDKQTYGPAHPEAAKSLHSVARSLASRGKYEEALQRMQSVLATLEAALGKTHVDLATALDEMGIIYRHLHRFSEAETMHRRALALRERGLGPEHVLTGISLDNLGLVVGLQGRSAEALPHHQRALAITQQRLGPDHIETAASHGYVANTYWQVGRYAEALAAFRQARDVTQKALGPDHVDLTFYLSGEGHVLLEMKRPREAVPVLERALRLDDATTGDPVARAEIEFALARALWNSGSDMKRARALAEKALPAVAAKHKITVENWLATHR